MKEGARMKRIKIITVGALAVGLLLASAAQAHWRPIPPRVRPALRIRPVVVVAPRAPEPARHWVRGHWEWFGPNRGYRWIPGHWVRG